MKSEESKGKKAKSQKLTANSQEHKVPWQESYASVDDIKAMLDSRVLLRYNEVRGRTEVHWLSQKLSDRRLGHAFLALGFEYRRTNVSRGYIVVQRSGLEIKERMQRLARDEVTK
jgi:hypothetical protein